MSKTKRCSWFMRYCCCCCCCCGDEAETTVHTPLLTKRETTEPPKNGFSELQVKEEGGEETQLMEVTVAYGTEDEGQKTPEVLEKVEKTVTPPPTKEESTTVSPSDHPQSEPSTFVRGTGARSSWRLVPTITSQAKEAAAAQSTGDQERVTTPTSAPPTTTPGTAAPPDGDRSSPEAKRKEPYRNFVLLPEDVDDESGTLEEEGANVTMTFTITDTQPHTPHSGEGGEAGDGGDSSRTSEAGDGGEVVEGGDGGEAGEGGEPSDGDTQIQEERKSDEVQVPEGDPVPDRDTNDDTTIDEVNPDQG